MLDSLLLSMDDISLEAWVVVTWVSKNLKVATDSLLGLVLGLTLDIHRLMLRVEMAKNLVQQLKELKRSLIVKLYQTKVGHEWWSVKTINNLFDLCGCKIWSLCKDFLTLVHSEDTSFAGLSIVILHI